IRHRPSLGVYESRGQGIEDVLRHGWERGSALSFGSDRLEVDEPGLEDGARQPLECLCPPAIVLDLVVERAEDGGDAALLFNGGQRDFHRALIAQTDIVCHVSLTFEAADLQPELSSLHPIKEPAAVYYVWVERPPVAELG